MNMPGNVRNMFVALCTLACITAAGQYRTETVVGGGVPPNVPALSSIRPGPLAAIFDQEFLIADGNSFVWRYAGAPTMTRILGSGVGGFNENGLPPLESHIGSISGLGGFDLNNVVFLDQGNFQVRLWNKVTNKIERLAGDGISGFAGDGTDALNSRVSNLIDLAIDSLGNILFIDGARVRRIDRTTRLITTIAGNGSTNFSGDGGPATQAGMNPSSITVDGENNVFIFDGARVRVVSPSGMISTYAGNGISGSTGDGGPATSARISANTPNGGARLAVDYENNLLISDLARIRRVDRSTRVISTIAGTIAGYDGDGGPASLAKLFAVHLRVTTNGDILFSQTINSVVRKISRQSGRIETIAGNGRSGHYFGDGPTQKNSPLSDPWAVTFDGNQTAYVASVALSRVFKLNLGSNTISTLAGDGFNGFLGDGGQATGARLNGPISLVVDKLNRLYIADQLNHRIRRINLSSGIIETIAGTGAPAYNGDNIPATSANIGTPGGLACDLNNNIYFVDRGNFRVRKIDITSGQITTIAGNGISGYTGDGGPAVSASIQSGRALCFGPDGNLYFADTFNHVVRKINLSSGTITTEAGRGEFGFSGDGGLATQAKLHFPAGIIFDSEGRLLISDSFNNRIRRVSSAGIIETIAGNGKMGYSGEGQALEEEFSFPRGLSINSAGEIFVAESNGNRIRKLVFDPTLQTPDVLEDVLASPNPVSKELQIEVPDPGMTIELINSEGRTVLQSFESSTRVSLQVESLPLGLYLLRVHQGNKAFIKRIVKR